MIAADLTKRTSNMSIAATSSSLSTATGPPTVPPPKFRTVSESTTQNEMTGSPESSKKGCHRCKECPGYTAHDWRNTCSSCKCPRSSHDSMLIGSNCCAGDRIGFDPLISLLGGKQGCDSVVSNGGCKAKALAEAEGYSWIPMVRY